MKKVITAIVLASAAISVFAACPAGSRYQCHPTWGGKMQCGCY
jgi:hypothetical protein